MNITDLLGTMVQQGMSKSTNKRLENVFGQGGREGGLMDELGDLLGKGASQGGGLVDKLGGLLGGAKNQQSGRSGGGLADMLGEVLGGGGSRGQQKGGGLGDLLGGLLGGSGGRSPSPQSSGGGLSDLLGGLLGGGSGKGLGSNKNLALGSLAALAAAVLGGKGGMKKALGGGALAMLATMAFSALKKSGHRAQVPLGLRAPENDIEVRELENNASLILTSMLNAAKADGQIDKDEFQKILGQAKEEGLDRETQEFIMAEVKKPIDLNGLCANARHQPELAAQLYAASLLAIEVDTQAEQAYMQQLGQGLGLDRATLQQLHTMVGVA